MHSKQLFCVPSKAHNAHLKPNLVLFSVGSPWSSTSGSHQGMLLWRLQEWYKPLKKLHDFGKRDWGNGFERADETNSPEDTSYTNLALAFLRTHSNFIAAGQVAQQVVCQWRNEPSPRNIGLLEWKKLEPGKIRWLRASNSNSSFCRWRKLKPDS